MVPGLPKLACANVLLKGDAVYEPLAATVVRKLTAEVATSALPDAPVRAEAHRMDR